MLYIYFWPKVSANSTCFALADASRSPLSGALADHQYVHSVRLLHNCMSAHWSRNPEKKPTRPPYAWITCQQSQVETAMCFVAGQSLCYVKWRHRFFNKTTDQNLVREALIFYPRRTPPLPFQCCQQQPGESSTRILLPKKSKNTC